MKSMKIKTYSVTKASSKEKKKSIEIMSNVDPKKQSGYTNQSDLNKLIKSPSLNISSKLDCKGKGQLKLGNRLININLFDKPIKNNFVEAKEKPCNLKSSNYFSSDSKNEDQTKNSFKFNQNPNISNYSLTPDNINIKLNFNSEVINNNIKISRPEAASSVNSVKSSFKEFVSPKNREKSKESHEKVISIKFSQVKSN